VMVGPELCSFLVLNSIRPVLLPVLKSKRLQQ
jgi:hypothetical protein